MQRMRELAQPKEEVLGNAKRPSVIIKLNNSSEMGWSQSLDGSPMIFSSQHRRNLDSEESKRESEVIADNNLPRSMSIGEARPSSSLEMPIVISHRSVDYQARL